jgi:hypothetical protein
VENILLIYAFLFFLVFGGGVNSIFVSFFLMFFRFGESLLSFFLSALNCIKNNEECMRVSQIKHDDRNIRDFLPKHQVDAYF